MSLWCHIVETQDWQPQRDGEGGEQKVQASDESAAKVVARHVGDHPAVTAVCIFVAALDLV